jgi:hypothetical protein
LVGADGHPRDLKSRPDKEAGAALAINLARQREIAAGKRVVNTQGRESIALADEKYQKAEDEDALGWMA